MTVERSNLISVVVGSWGSYNECNERALGSKWLKFNDFNDFEEIKQELQMEGFELDGIDEELFIQDIEGIYESGYNWDYCNPETLFERLKESGVLDDESKYEMMDAYLENNSLDDWFELVELHGEEWDQNMFLRSDCKDWDSYGHELMDERGYELPDDLEWYFDFKEYGESVARDGSTYLTDYGVLEIFE